MGKHLREPRGYQEIGESLAEPVALGYKPQSWANQLGRLLGYKPAECQAWTEFYQHRNRQKLRRLSQRQQRRQDKIDRLKAELQGLEERRQEREDG